MMTKLSENKLNDFALLKTMENFDCKLDKDIWCDIYHYFGIKTLTKFAEYEIKMIAQMMKQNQEMFGQELSAKSSQNMFGICEAKQYKVNQKLGIKAIYAI
eukprot:756780_1